MSNPAGTRATDPGWLRSEHYDLTLIRDVTLIALVSGLVVVLNPALFPIVFLADLWLLGYHHVIATMTRLVFDRRSLQQHRFLVFGLPVIVFGATFLLAWQVGVWIIASIYLYWQWFHYSRQSWGISQAYRRKAGDRMQDNPLLTQLCFYLVPAYGILYRSWQAPDTFLFLELRVIPVPVLLVDAVGMLALVTFLLWAVGRVAAWHNGRLAVAHTAYMLSHFVIFLVGYRVIDDITHGWLVINIWHNAQYILFVWLFNTNRFKNGIDPSARFLSWLSQSSNKFKYFLVCFGISTVAYALVGLSVGGQILAGLPLIVIIYQGVNFHHYIVDAVIWKMRKKRLRQNLGLERS